MALLAEPARVAMRVDPIDVATSSAIGAVSSAPTTAIGATMQAAHAATPAFAPAERSTWRKIGGAALGGLYALPLTIGVGAVVAFVEACSQFTSFPILTPIYVAMLLGDGIYRGWQGRADAVLNDVNAATSWKPLRL